LSQALPELVARHQVDCVIANVENSAGGSGLTPTLYEKISRYGVNLMTLGDHIYKRREIYPTLESAGNIVKPANLPDAAPGKVYAVYESESGHKVAVVSILGQIFMKMPCNSPFAAIDGVLRIIPNDVKIVVVDVHAETTSEKIALGWHLDGRVSCVFGTHTHVPTADERILPGGTAYITDLGMTGPYDSVLGRRKDRVVSTMRTAIPSPFDVAIGEPAVSGIVVKVDPDTGKALEIERVRVECEPCPQQSPRDHGD
jgi:metallophosphoesterase (TIGR00282 family)